MKLGFGILECFFGPAWSVADRRQWAPFMAEHGFNFYLYGPKSDSRLRKNWQEAWPDAYQSELKSLARVFLDRGIGFGIALTPHSAQFNRREQASMLESKIQTLEKLGMTHLGLFFDDLRSSDGMAENQIQAIDIARANTNAKIIFCPNYYSFDPILDRVFGDRPSDYLSTIAAKAPDDVSIFWTGPKVISPEITPTHLDEVTALLERRPVIFDNLFANDGPKQCDFLKLVAPNGRSKEATLQASGWAFNPMNQATLSRIAVLAAKNRMSDNQPATLALYLAIKELCPADLAVFLSSNANTFATLGLKGIDAATNSRLRTSLASNSHPAALEVLQWLRCEFTVGDECLTD